MRKILSNTPRALVVTVLLGHPQVSSAKEATYVEAWVTVESPSELALLRQLPLSFAEGREGNRLRMIGPSEALSKLREQGLEVTILREDHRHPITSTAGYHDLDEMRAALEQLAIDHPERVTFMDLGESVQGRQLSGVRISGDQPWNVRVLGGHHGNEGSSLELPLTIAETLLDRDPSTLPNVWIVPHLNPDGIAEGSRYNARDVDLNRNYDYKWSGSGHYAGSAAMSEPETRAVRTLSIYRQFASGLSVHSGAENIGWPWNYQESDSTDESLLAAQATAYAEACDIEGFYATNGAEWYITNGDTNDWSYGRQGTFDYTLEVSKTKTPSEDELALVLSAHTEPSLDFIERTPSLVLTVTDAETGASLQATAKPFGGWKTRAGPDGRLARWLEPGPVELTVAAEGYEDRELSLDISESELLEIDVSLDPDDLVLVEPSDPLLPWGETSIPLTLDAWKQVKDASLFRPGFADVDLTVSGDTLYVDTTALEPGPWGIEVDGAISPNTLFVGERTDRVEILSVEWEPPAATFFGSGFGAGSQAFVVSPPERALSSVPLLQENESALSFDLSDVDLSGTIDVVVVSNGAQLTIVDLTGDPLVDTAAPADTDAPIPTDTGTPASTGDPPTRGGCGCSIQGNALSSATGTLWSLLMIGWATRRRTRSHGTRV